MFTSKHRHTNQFDFHIFVAGEIEDTVQQLDDGNLHALATDVKAILGSNAILTSIEIAELKDIQRACIAEQRDRQELADQFGIGRSL